MTRAVDLIIVLMVAMAIATATPLSVIKGVRTENTPALPTDAGEFYRDKSDAEVGDSYGTSALPQTERAPHRAGVQHFTEHVMMNSEREGIEPSSTRMASRQRF